MIGLAHYRRFARALQPCTRRELPERGWPARSRLYHRHPTAAQIRLVRGASAAPGLLTAAVSGYPAARLEDAEMGTKPRTRTANRSRARARTRHRPPVVEPSRWARLLRDLGPLRIVLALGTFLVLVFAPRPGTAAVLSGWAMFPTLIVPTLAPIFFMVLMLDALMARVHMTSVRGEVLARYRRIVLVDLLLGLVLVGYWTPYFIALGRP